MCYTLNFNPLYRTLVRSLTGALSCVGAGLFCATPKRAGRRNNLCTELKWRISSYSSGPSASCHPTAGHPKSKISLSQAIASKLEDGNIRAAVRLLTSQESPATPSAETLASLRDKHPTSSGKAMGWKMYWSSSMLYARQTSHFIRQGNGLEDVLVFQ